MRASNEGQVASDRRNADVGRLLGTWKPDPWHLPRCAAHAESEHLPRNRSRSRCFAFGWDVGRGLNFIVQMKRESGAPPVAEKVLLLSPSVPQTSP